MCKEMYFACDMQNFYSKCVNVLFKLKTDGTGKYIEEGK